MFSQRKWLVMPMSIATTFFLAACGSSMDMTEYIDVSFSGMDSQGSAIYEVDETGLIDDIFDLEGQPDYPDRETADESANILDAYNIDMGPEENLSNGDTVNFVVSVDEERTSVIQGGEVEFTVEGLDEPELLKTEDVENNLVLNFNGMSGRGVAQIDNIFDASPMNSLNFEVENDGNLENEDEAEIIIGEGAEEALHSDGYILDEGFNPTFEVNDLDKVAETATDINNLSDIERFMEEELNNEYVTTDRNFGPDTVYEIKQEMLMYRQFDNEADDEMDDGYSEENHGNLIGIFSVEEYRVDENDENFDREQRDAFTAILGFSGIILDEDDEANISELEQINEQHDDTYSVESVIQLYEGDGYEEVNDDAQEHQ